MTKPDNEQDQSGPQSGPNTTKPDTRWFPLAAAARRLGLSQDTTRKRLERGLLTGEKRGGRWFVALSESDQTGQPDTTKTDESGPETGPNQTKPDSPPDDQRTLLAHLTTENAWLRVQLEERSREVDARSRELAAERERADTLHRLSLMRIEALTAGLVERDADDQTEPESSRSDDVAPSATIAAKPGDVVECSVHGAAEIELRTVVELDQRTLIAVGGAAATWVELQAAHTRFLHNYNHQSHAAHDDRSKGRRSPAMVLGWVQGAWCDRAALDRLFRLRSLRHITARGTIRFRHWRLYAERGLAGARAAVWVNGEMLTLAYETETLAQYRIVLDTESYHLRDVTEPRFFVTSHGSPQLFLPVIETVEWQPAQRLSPYQPRRLRGAVGRQEPLFDFRAEAAPIASVR